MNTTTFHPLKRFYLLCAVWTLLTYLITAIHHYYTGILYHTMWRAEFAWYAILPTTVCIIALWIHYRYGRRIASSIFVLVSLLFFFLVVGLWEGAWCHTAKLIFYFLGVPFHNAPATWNIPAAPAPTDVFSEVTGVLNFVFAAIQLHYLGKLIKRLSHPLQAVSANGMQGESI